MIFAAQRVVAPATLLMGMGVLALAAPTLVMIARESWTDEQAQQGPLVLAIGGWLLWRHWPQMRQGSQPGAMPWIVAAFGLCGLAYLVGRVAELILLEGYALYGFLVASVYALVGVKGVRRAGFPLLMIAFAVPVPFAVGWPVTTALRLAISDVTVHVFQAFGTPATRDGLTLFIANYRIEIAQACSGMNSLLALTALGVCYVHLRRDPPARYLLVMMPLIILFAITANFVRVLLLASLTLSLGDVIAQGPLHQLLGLATFAVALALTFLADKVFGRTAWAKRAAARA